MILTNEQQNGNGSKDYQPAVEDEYLDADVWFKITPDGKKEIVYTDQVTEALFPEPESDVDSTQN